MSQIPNDGQNNSCNMVGLMGILIQVALGVLSFSVLIIKRLRERPRRPWKIWLFDTSKQLVSQMLAHFINLTISIALTYKDSSSDECLWYFITNILDNTLGVLICVLSLKAIENSLRKRGKGEYISGNYYKIVTAGHEQQIQLHHEEHCESSKQNTKKSNQVESVNNNANLQQNQHKKTQLVSEKQGGQSDIDMERESKPTIDDTHSTHTQHTQEHYEEDFKIYDINYKAWLVQLLIWNAVVVVSKSIFFGIQFGFEDTLKNVSFSLMGWIEQYQILQLMVVIVIIPVIMNGLAFWVQDNFLMKKDQPHSAQDNGLVEEIIAKRQRSNQN